MTSYKQFISFLMPWLALALIMNLMRLFMTETPSYVWMNWNLFLGIIPLLAVFLFEQARRKGFQIFWILVWFFFLPNAAYKVTDFIHIRNVGPDWILWFDGMMLFAYAFLGVMLGAYSLIRLQEKIFEKHAHKAIFLGVVSVISAFGIYLGRYIRWNTWDIVTRPLELFGNIGYIIQHDYFDPVFITTLIFFTLCIGASVISLRKVIIQKNT